ncbi:MAG: PIN domain-containing protein [Acidobacteriia bacterium]|nr:PIN domain-containing protein [Terriglobia bacterium]
MTKFDAGHQIVIDTNVLVAGLRSRRGSSYQLVQLLGDKRFRPNVSVSNLVEVRFRLRPTPARLGRRAYPGMAAQCEAMIVTFNIDDFSGAEAFGIRVLRPVKFLRLLGEMQWS